MNTVVQDISHVNNVYERYVNKTGEIILFIKVAEEQKDFIANFAGRDYNGFLSNLNSLSNSAVLYNAAIISIYGSYELFIDEVLKAYISYLKRDRALYEGFPDSLKRKHLYKSAEYLLNPNHFTNMGLSNESVIAALEASCIQKSSNAMLDSLMLAHGGNLNTIQLRSLLSDFGIKDPIQKISKHIHFRDKRKEQRDVGFEIYNEHEDESFPFLHGLVLERNKVAHGWIVENRIAFSELREKYLSNVILMCEAVKDLLISQIIQDAIDNNQLFAFDSIIGTWSHGQIIGVNNGDFTLKKGDTLFFSTEDAWNYPFTVMDIHYDENPVSIIEGNNKEISIKCSREIKQKYTIWGFPSSNT